MNREETIHRMKGIYSKEGITDMVAETERHIEQLKCERDDVGMNWTDGKIADWQREYDKEIEEDREKLDLLKELLSQVNSENKYCTCKDSNPFNVLCSSCTPEKKACSK